MACLVISRFDCTPFLCEFSKIKLNIYFSMAGATCSRIRETPHCQCFFFICTSFVFLIFKMKDREKRNKLHCIDQLWLICMLTTDASKLHLPSSFVAVMTVTPLLVMYKKIELFLVMATLINVWLFMFALHIQFATVFLQENSAQVFCNICSHQNCAHFGHVFHTGVQLFYSDNFMIC